MRKNNPQKLLKQFDQLVHQHGIQKEADVESFRVSLIAALRIKDSARQAKLSLVLDFIQLQHYLEKMPNLYIADLNALRNKSEEELQYLYNSLRIDSAASIQDIYESFLRTAENLQQGKETAGVSKSYASIDEFEQYRQENERMFCSELRKYRRNYCSRQLADQLTGECKAFHFVDASVIVLSGLQGDSLYERLDNMAAATIQCFEDCYLAEQQYFMTLNDQLTFRLDDHSEMWPDEEIKLCCLQGPYVQYKDSHDVSELRPTEYFYRYRLIAVLGSLLDDASGYRIFDLREVPIERMQRELGQPVLVYYEKAGLSAGE